MKTANKSGIYNLEIVKADDNSGYTIAVDGSVASNEKVVDAFGGDVETFEWLINLYNNGKVTNPVVMTDKSRLEMALLFAVTRRNLVKE